MSICFGVSCFLFCWMGESWLLNFTEILAHWLGAELPPTLHMTSSENLGKQLSSEKRQDPG